MAQPMAPYSHFAHAPALRYPILALPTTHPTPQPLQVSLSGPGAVAHYSDPKLQRLHENLNELNRKLTAGELDIPPEHERSPSPEPIYDANGVRLNTREIRCVGGCGGRCMRAGAWRVWGLGQGGAWQLKSRGRWWQLLCHHVHVSAARGFE